MIVYVRYCNSGVFSNGTLDVRFAYLVPPLGQLYGRHDV